MFAVIVAVGFLKRIGHETGHLSHREIGLNVIPSSVKHLQERVDVSGSENRADNCLNDLLLMFLAGEVSGRERMTFSCKGKCLFAIQQNVISCRNPDRIGAAGAGRSLSDEFQRRIHDDSPKSIDNINHPLEIRIDIVIDIDSGQVFNCLDRAADADRMS